MCLDFSQMVQTQSAHPQHRRRNSNSKLGGLANHQLMCDDENGSSVFYLRL